MVGCRSLAGQGITSLSRNELNCQLCEEFQMVSSLATNNLMLHFGLGGELTSRNFRRNVVDVELVL